MENKKSVCAEDLKNRIETVDINFGIIESLIRCVDNLLQDELTAKSSDAANLLELLKKVISETKINLEIIEDKLKL